MPALRCLLLPVIGLLLLGDSLPAADSREDWQAGFARVVITPDEPMWLSGYGNRGKPSEGKIHDLYARAAALRDPAGKTVVVLSTDLIGLSAEMSDRLTEAVSQKYGLRRADLMLTSSHTHCGPALDQNLSHMLAMTDQDWAQVRKYQSQLDRKLVEVVSQAIDDRSPAQLAWGNGQCGFARNRRQPTWPGPSDHQVPVLKITSPEGKLRGVVFGYACHNTTLDIQQWCGDYAGFAQLYLEDQHPGITAAFFTGCGADQNPLPRRTLELAEQYGRMLGVAVEEVLSEDMHPVRGAVRAAFRTIDLPFASLPSKTELEERLKTGSRFEQARARNLLKEIERDGAIKPTYPYPIQVWQLGEDLTWVALGGEVVVDYSLRLKQELGEGHTWITGYANDVMAYIPSERVLKEGGYEGATAMLYYQLPSPWKAGLENEIVGTVKQMAADLRADRGR